MSKKRKRHISYLTITLLSALLIALAVLVPAMSLGQEGETATGPDLKVEIIETDLIYDFVIPTPEEMAQNKERTMATPEYRLKEERLGKAEAEKRLDEEMREAVEYRKEMNRKGKDKIELVKVGENSAYFTRYTYKHDGGCTGIIVDPMNLFFWNWGATGNVVTHMMNDVAPTWEPGSIVGNQCAWTGDYNKQPLYVSDLRMQDYQLQLGDSLGERHHMRLWNGGVNDPQLGYWTVANTHYERYEWWLPDHCVLSYEGSENFVRDQTMGAWFTWWNVPQYIYNQFGKTGCDGSWVNNDGYARFIEITL